MHFVGPLFIRKQTVCVARLPQSQWNEPKQKLCMCVSYIFNALEINKYIVQKHLMYHVYTHTHTYALQVCMSTSGIVIHYTG
jgi:hypothetical protein